MVDGSIAAAASDQRSGPKPSRAAVILVAAAAVGVYSDRGALLPQPWNAFAEIGTSFVLVAFAAGRQASRMALAVLWGAAVLSAALAAYYAWLLLVEDVSWGTITSQYRPVAWLAAGVLVGVFAGGCGSASRRERGRPLRAVAWGLVIVSPLAEGVRVFGWQPPQPVAGPSLLLLAVGLYGWAVRRDRAPWQAGLVTVAAAAPAVFVAENFRHLI